jgi:ribonuclease I
MELIKAYEKELEARELQSIEIGEGENAFVEGIISQLKRTIQDLKKQGMNDRFFLEEIVYKISQKDEDHYSTLTRDFLSEYVENLPLTEFERNQYIKDVMGFGEETDYYFKSEKQLAYFLKEHKLPSEEDLIDYSITDLSSK